MDIAMYAVFGIIFIYVVFVIALVLPRQVTVVDGDDRGSSNRHMYAENSGRWLKDKENDHETGR